jgi:adenylate cyclase
VHQIKQAITLAERNRDLGRLATLHAALSHAYGWAGLLREALEASDASFACIAEVTEFDQRFLGYSVEDWVVGLRGRILLRLGQFDAARVFFDKLTSIKGLIDPTVLFIAHVGYVDMAWCVNDPVMASEHATRIAVLADRHGGPYLRMYQLSMQAIADGIAGNYGQAAEGTSRAVGFLRQTGAAVEFEPELLANLADYQMRMGDLANATATARDTIAMGRARGARLPVCRATITLASLAILIEGAAGRGAAISLLAEAEQLIEESGASIYRPRLEEVRTLDSHAGGPKS